MRSRSFSGDMPGVRRVGMNLPDLWWINMTMIINEDDGSFLP